MTVTLRVQPGGDRSGSTARSLRRSPAGVKASRGRRGTSSFQRFSRDASFTEWRRPSSAATAAAAVPGHDLVAQTARRRGRRSCCRAREQPGAGPDPAAASRSVHTAIVVRLRRAGTTRGEPTRSLDDLVRQISCARPVFLYRRAQAEHWHRSVSLPRPAGAASAGIEHDLQPMPRSRPGGNGRRVVGRPSECEKDR
jgi:hypothetical protein